MLTKREFLKGSALTLAGLPLGFGCSATPRAAPDNRVIVLGFDGLDPVILERLAREGALPNFAALMARGDFRPLGTTVPPLSPVAETPVKGR